MAVVALEAASNQLTLTAPKLIPQPAASDIHSNCSDRILSDRFGSVRSGRSVVAIPARRPLAAWLHSPTSGQFPLDAPSALRAQSDKLVGRAPK